MVTFRKQKALHVQVADSLVALEVAQDRLQVVQVQLGLDPKDHKALPGHTDQLHLRGLDQRIPKNLDLYHLGKRQSQRDQALRNHTDLSHKTPKSLVIIVPVHKGLDRGIVQGHTPGTQLGLCHRGQDQAQQHLKDQAQQHLKDQALPVQKNLNILGILVHLILEDLDHILREGLVHTCPEDLGHIFLEDQDPKLLPDLGQMLLEGQVQMNLRGLD